MRVLGAMRGLLPPICLAAALTGCQAFSFTNKALEEPARATPVRATFNVDAARGNPRVLFFLALSGGGSRAAYLSAATMLKLQTVFDDIDLLREVDVISSVSGGSLPAAYYVVSRDESLELPAALAAAASISPKLSAQEATLRCTAPLSPEERARLRTLADARAAARIDELCGQSELKHLNAWTDAAVRERMTRNYLVRWFGNWFWPHNVLRYWFTAYDRSDIMAETFEDNLYGTPGLVSRTLSFRDLSPYRPFLIVNATNATEQNHLNAAAPDEFAFGSVFTFTDEDFRARLRSDIRDYSLARAVMASSAFPLVFPNMTLADFRPAFRPGCDRSHRAADRVPDCRPLYQHVFDGGNSDNLGLRSIKRALFEMALAGRLDPENDRVIVLLVDAFTQPLGARRTEYDPRGLASFIVDFNVVDAIDSLLQANRARIVGEFRSAQLRWREGDCSPQSQNLPPTLCRDLEARFGRQGVLDLGRSMAFYHFGFDDVEKPELKARLDQIRTSFQIGEAEARALDEAVDLVLSPQNLCLGELRRVLRDEVTDMQRTRALCAEIDKLPVAPGG